MARRSRSPDPLETFLYSADVAVLRWINQGWSCSPLDVFFSFVTEYRHFLWAFIPAVLYLLWKGGPKGRWFILSLSLGILLADQTASHLLKPWVERVRPCNVLEGILTPAGKSSAYSFPSSHAANMGAALVLLALTYGRWAWLFAPLALASGLSRIYLGLHYPSDVAAGYLLGTLVGFGVWWITEKAKLHFPPPSSLSSPRRQKKKI